MRKRKRQERERKRKESERRREGERNRREREERQFRTFVPSLKNTPHLLGMEMVEVLSGLVLVGEADRHALVIAGDVVHEHVPEPTGYLVVWKPTENAYFVGDLKTAYKLHVMGNLKIAHTKCTSWVI